MKVLVLVDMGLSIIFSDIQEILTNYPNDIKDNILSYLDEILEDSIDHKNILGIYEPDSSFDSLRDRLTDDLVTKMNKLIKSFNLDMVNLINITENEFKKKIK